MNFVDNLTYGVQLHRPVIDGNGAYVKDFCEETLNLYEKTPRFDYPIRGDLVGANQALFMNIYANHWNGYKQKFRFRTSSRECLIDQCQKYREKLKRAIGNSVDDNFINSVIPLHHPHPRFIDYQVSNLHNLKTKGVFELLEFGLIEWDFDLFNFDYCFHDYRERTANTIVNYIDDFTDNQLFYRTNYKESTYRTLDTFVSNGELVYKCVCTMDSAMVFRRWIWNYNSANPTYNFATKLSKLFYVLVDEKHTRLFNRYFSGFFNGIRVIPISNLSDKWQNETKYQYKSFKTIDIANQLLNEKILAKYG